MNPTSRLKHIDSLRGIAVLLVIWIHVSERYINLSPAVKASGELLYAIAWNINVGRIGVVIFFAISGFVLLQSIRGDKVKGTKTFLLRRFFRLYPVFWLSILPGIFIIQLRGESVSIEKILANISMVPLLFQQEMIIGLYWTLEAEIFFYLLGLLLFLLGKSDKPGSIFICSISLLIIFLAARPSALHYPKHIGLALLAFHLSIMFWGALFRQFYDNPDLITTIIGKSIPIKHLLQILSFCILVIPLAALIKGMATNEFKFTQFGLANILGILIFIWLSLYFKIKNRLLTWIGTISYSMYLFHPVIFSLIYWWLINHAPSSLRELHLGVYLGINVICSLFFSTLIYYVIEKPCIKLAHSLTNYADTPQRATKPKA